MLDTRAPQKIFVVVDINAAFKSSAVFQSSTDIRVDWSYFSYLIIQKKALSYYKAVHRS